MMAMRQQAERFGTRIMTEDILSVDLTERPFVWRTRPGSTVETHTLVIATGARANYLGLDSEGAYKNRGVSACAVCDGALPRFRNQPVIVVGGGDSACEEANYLTKFASKVYLVHRRDTAARQQDHGRTHAEEPEDRAGLEQRWSRRCLAMTQTGMTGARVKQHQDWPVHSDRAGDRDVRGHRAHAQREVSRAGRSRRMRRVSSACPSRSRRIRASREFSRPATWPIRFTSRRSRRPAWAAKLPWMPNATWRRKVSTEAGRCFSGYTVGGY